jgi:peroxiredoxin
MTHRQNGKPRILLERGLARHAIAAAALCGLSFLALVAPLLTTPAHAGVMDYLFKTVKDFTTPVEQATPAEETKIPIPHPAVEAPEPARTLVFDIQDAKTGAAIADATCSYYHYNVEGGSEKGSVTFKDKPELALPAGTVSAGVTIWAPGYAASSSYLVLKSKPERVEVPSHLEKGTSAGGTVVNEEEQPVEGATVEVQALGQNRGGAMLGEIVTDAHGHWSTQNVPAETEKLTLRVAHPAYIPSCSMDAQRYTHVVARGENIQVRLVHGVPLSGRVVDEQGNPVAGAHLHLDDLGQEPPFAISADGDMDGRFRLEHCPVRKATVIASAPGFAPNAVPVTIASDMPETVMALPPARPVSFLVVDPQQVPLANAHVYVNASRGELQLYSGGKGLRTDAQGMFSLTDAPRRAAYYLNVGGWGYTRKVEVGPSDEPVRVVLPAMGCLVLRAVDASTGKRIQDFEVQQQNDYAGTGNAQQPWYGAGRAEAGEFVRQNQGNSGKVRYRIDIPGYRRGTTRWIGNEDGKLQIALSLRPAPMREGHVLDAQGKPAPTPVVQWVDGPYFSVGNNTSWSGASPVKGDQRGVFSITSRDWESGMLLATADAGMALVSGVDFEAVSTVRLKPGGRVVCEMPTTPNVEASLSGTITERSRVQVSYTCTLDGDGKGVFEKVYPGQYSVARLDTSEPMRHEYVPVGSVTALSGQTVEVSIHPGRKVVAQVDVPDEAKPWLAKRRDGLAVQLRTADSGSGGSVYGNGTVWLHPDPSGRVELTELAPGAYALRVEPLFNQEQQLDGTPIKRYFESDEVKFAVRPSAPGDDAPLDLGTIRLHAEGEAAPPAAETPQPGFIVDKLEGGTLSLQDLRGRYVLIDFWAVWCKLCQAQEPHLKQVWQEFGKRDDFVMLGLCLGDNPKLIREFVSAHEIPWPQGMLQDSFSNVVAEHYGVTSLPQILLIGPDGKAVADNLLDDKIESAVQAALKSARP